MNMQIRNTKQSYTVPQKTDDKILQGLYLYTERTLAFINVI